jgi:tail collar domain protein|nr:MAG TPA: tail collar domain [Caudoviricetes sp.]
MKPYTAAKQWRDGFGANETRITAADLTHIEDGISAATQGVTNVETTVNALTARAASAENKAKATDEYILGTKAELKTDILKAVPIGTILMWATSTPPEGWLLCNGKEVSRAAYPELFKVLGTSVGAAGSSSFKIPDLSGRFPLGTSNAHNLHSTGGAETHTLTVDEMPAHAHGVGGNIVQRGSGGDAFRELSGAYPGGNNSPSQRVGRGLPHNNMPPYYGINFIIRAK